jgi:D-alanine-D-alanine ligase
MRIGRIGVLMGGTSSEREISLKSGQAVYQALKEQGLDVLPLDIRGSLVKKLKQTGISLAFIALHGRFGEDGTVQGILESLGIAYTGSGPMASFLCLDKIASRRIFRHYNFPVPEYKVLERSFWSKDSQELDFAFPVVVKPCTQGSSIGVTFVNEPTALKRAIKLAFGYDDTVLVERYMQGREITVGILEDKALPVVEIVPKSRFFDFSAKYEKGQSDYIIPARLSPKQHQTACKLGLLAHQALGCRTFSRVDMILSKAGPVILELNSIPGLTSTSLLPMAAKAKGISFKQLCLRIIQSAAKRSRK